MRIITIEGCEIGFIKLPLGKATHTIDWNEKPHRNSFRKRNRENINLDIYKEIWMGESLVSQKLWKGVMGYNPSCFIGENRPVESVSFNEISLFLERLRETSHWRFSLPTETEYLYACSLNYEKSLSSKIDESVCYERNSENKTQPIGVKKAGELMFNDLLGNLYQFLMADITEVKDNECIYRGAAWSTNALWVDQDYSFVINKDHKINTIGFRLVFDFVS